MSSGGGTTTQVTKNELPAWLQDAAQGNLARADFVSKIGYVPQYGLDVAGFTPMQTSAMQNTADAASAFGLAAPSNAMAGMPAQQTNNLGFSGYSSGDLYRDYLGNFQQQAPSQFAALNSMFIDPVTGELGVSWDKSGTAVVNPDAQYTSYAPSYGGNYVAPEGSSFPDNYVTQNTGLMPQWMEDVALSAANMGPIGTFLSPASKMLGTFAIDNQMDTLAQQQSVYDNPSYGKEGFEVVADEYGNLNLVDRTAERVAREQAAAAAARAASSSNSFDSGYNWGSASNASRQSSMLDSGTGSGIGSGGGNASRGFSTGGW
jgi:hypothetical protein